MSDPENRPVSAVNTAANPAADAVPPHLPQAASGDTVQPAAVPVQPIVDFDAGTVFTGGGGESYAQPVRLLLKYANRHGLIAGATGTGKTVTLQTLAEALSMAGVTARHAAATKNVLASVMNAAAVALFVTSPLVHWPQAIALGAGAILGGLAGVWALRRVNERWLRIAIVCIGLALTVGLFVKPV